MNLWTWNLFLHKKLGHPGTRWAFTAALFLPFTNSGASEWLTPTLSAPGIITALRGALSAINGNIVRWVWKRDGSVPVFFTLVFRWRHSKQTWGESEYTALRHICIELHNFPRFCITSLVHSVLYQSSWFVADTPAVAPETPMAQNLMSSLVQVHRAPASLSVVLRRSSWA